MNWTRKEIKINAKATIKKNTMNIIIVCFIVTIIASGYSFSTLGPQVDSEDLNVQTPPALSSEVSKTVDNIQKEFFETESDINEIEKRFTIKGATEGVIATIINNSGPSKSFLMGILNTANKFFFDNKILAGTITGIATLIMFSFWLFVKNILLVGEARFFLETKNYPESNSKRLLFVYRVGKTLHVAWVMFVRAFYIFLWSLTIVGGVFFHYAYSLVPYILAENPTIPCKEALKLSKEMMKGNKWKAFKLDVSFLPWEMLSGITLGIVGFVYVNPYIGATHSELYFALRQQAIEQKYPLSDYLNDKYLTTLPTGEYQDSQLYPYPLYTLPTVTRRELTSLDYNRDYSILSLVYIFFAMSFLGWFWEVFLYIFKTGGFVNRGTLIGPWLPIYGFGSVFMIVLLKRFREKPAVFFIGAMVVCGSLEYFLSWALEYLFHTKWWDYSNIFFNINGRISLEGLLFFATGGSLVIYVLAPVVDDIVKNIPEKYVKKIATILVIIFLSDVVSGFINPNTGAGISTPAKIDSSPSTSITTSESLNS